MHFSVAIVIHGLWGVNATELTGSVKSIYLECDPSTTDHRFTTPLWSPLARYLFGANAIVLIWDLCPVNVYLSCMVFLSQILIYLSHDAVARTPSFSGENLTWLTQSKCSIPDWFPVIPSIEYLQSPFTFHNLMLLSLEPDTIWRLSGEKATERTSFSWPIKVAIDALVLKSQSLKVLSQLDDTAYLPSYERATSSIKWLWPEKDFTA